MKVCTLHFPSYYIFAACLGVKKLGDLFRERNHFICIGADETDDARASNDYIITVDVTLIPKAMDDFAVKSFHLQLSFPEV